MLTRIKPSAQKRTPGPAKKIIATTATSAPSTRSSPRFGTNKPGLNPKLMPFLEQEKDKETKEKEERKAKHKERMKEERKRKIEMDKIEGESKGEEVKESEMEVSQNEEKSESQADVRSGEADETK